MLYPDVLKKLADAVDDDLVIIPSSIHEVLLLPERLAGTSRSLNEMVQEVNRQGVEPIDRLSDHVYYFRREGCLITVPQGSCLTTKLIKSVNQMIYRTTADRFVTGKSTLAR